jgi:UTP--glucose-1-phosphate uridylyltransferase
MKITQAILPVAGLGTRFLPWTKVVPKELLPLGKEPIIAHIVDECMAAGIEDICFVISKGKEKIPEYFYDDPALEEELKRRGKHSLIEPLKRYSKLNFHTVYQRDQLGDGHAILQAKDWVQSDYVAVLFGDDLFTGAKPGIAQLKEVFEHHAKGEGAIVALENVPRENTNRYGIVGIRGEDPTDPRLKIVSEMVEKPDPKDAPSTLGIVGRYIIPRSTFDVLPTVQGSHGGEIRLIDALIAQLAAGMPMYGYACDGTRVDTGTPEGYARALKVFESIGN